MQRRRAASCGCRMWTWLRPPPTTPAASTSTASTAPPTSSTRRCSWRRSAASWWSTTLSPGGWLETKTAASRSTAPARGPCSWRRSATARLTIWGASPPPPDLSFNPAVDYSLGISTYPLLLIQLTRFKCGGVCLGHGNQHHLSDGPAALRFTKTWFDLARSLATATATTISDAPPFMDRTLLRARDPPQPRFTHIEYHRGGTPPKPISSAIITSEKTYSVFKLTSDQINALKAKCNVGSGDGGNGPFPAARYTTFEVLAGHVWRCVSEARGLPGDQETKLYVSTDGRSRLSPPLPPGYFGNVNFSATAVSLCGQLRSNNVRFAAGKTREAIARMDDEYLRSAIDYLEVQPDISAIARGPRTYNSPNLGIISWLRLPVYEADFGWGNPVHVGLAAPPPEGKCHFLPSPASDGSLLVSISLAKEHMRLFEKLLFDF
ncbi:hypothetical protein ABFX02_04G110100 [Erythranthe guttata]